MRTQPISTPDSNKPRRSLARRVAPLLAGLLLLCLLCTAASAISNLVLPQRSEVTDRLSEAEKARLAEALHLKEALGEAAWPGFGQAEIPVILFNEAYAFLVRYPDPPPGWIKVPHNDLRGGPWEIVPGDTFEGEPYYRQQLPDRNTNPEAFAVLVGERWTGSIPTAEWTRISLAEPVRNDLPPALRPVVPYRWFVRWMAGTSDQWISLLLHECFHAYQGQVAAERLAAAERSMVEEDGYPWDEPGLAEAWKTEMEILQQALRAEDAGQVRSLAAQFLEQRNRRRSDYPVSRGQVDFERQREWLEGQARYFELEIWRQGSRAGYMPLPAATGLPDFDSYQKFAQRWEKEIDQLQGPGTQPDEGRFYYSGMAQAYLLDKLLPGWKEQAMQPGVWLEDLLARAIR